MNSYVETLANSRINKHLRQLMENEANGNNPNIRRVFLGKISDFDSVEEQRFEKAHLEAYKKGKLFFTFGKDSKGNKLVYEVLYNYIDTTK